MSALCPACGYPLAPTPEYHDDSPDALGRRRYTLHWHDAPRLDDPRAPACGRRGQVFHCVPRVQS